MSRVRATRSCENETARSLRACVVDVERECWGAGPDSLVRAGSMGMVGAAAGSDDDDVARVAAAMVAAKGSVGGEGNGRCDGADGKNVEFQS